MANGKTSVFQKRRLPLEVVIGTAPNSLIDETEKFEFVEGKRGKLIAIAYTVANLRKHEVFTVVVNDPTPLIPLEEFERMMEDDEAPAILVEFENATIKPYVGRDGFLADSIKADGIRLVEPQED